MPKSGGYKAAIRDKIRKFGVIYEVLKEHKRLVEVQKLIYDHWLRFLVGNELKTACLNSLFDMSYGRTEADIFRRFIPWSNLTEDQKRDYENLWGWIKNREYEYN